MGRNQTPRKSRPSPPQGLKAVFFDAGNTLLKAHPSVGHIYARTARRHGVRVPTDWVESRFRSAWAARHRLGTPRSDRGERTWWRRMVHGVLGSRFSPSAFRRYFDDLFASFAHPAHWRLFPDAVPTLRALRRRGFRVGIVSNWDSRLLTLADGIGLTREVEFLLVSAVEGVVKPDRRIFERALARARVLASEALHVGDSLREDYHGARGAGLQAALLERHAEGPEGVTVVRTLTEVITLAGPGHGPRAGKP